MGLVRSFQFEKVKRTTTYPCGRSARLLNIGESHGQLLPNGRLRSGTMAAPQARWNLQMTVWYILWRLGASQA